MKQPSWRGGAIVGAYRIIDHIGSGGMGEVYLAEDSRLGRKVALKILPREVTSDAKRVERFEREARAASALNHPAIVTIHEVGREGNVYYIAAEYIEGETLRARTNRDPLRQREALDVATQIAAALGAAHAAGIVHRDIKPENVMLRPDGYVKVLDFGLAKLMATDVPTDIAVTMERTTEAGMVVGTVHYMSPEQARGHGKIDARSDLFSLGTLLYEMVTGGCLPFDGETSSHVMVSILEHAPPPLSQYVDDVPPELQRIVSKALEKDPEKRYQTAKDLLVDLRHLKHELEVSGDVLKKRQSEPTMVLQAPRRSTVDTLVSGIRNHKRAAITTLLVLLIAAGALFVPPLLREAESGTRIPIAVADFDNQTGEKALDGLSGMLITSLEQSRRLTVMTRSRMFDTLRRLGKNDVAHIDESHGREIAQAENMRGLVTASVNKFGDLYIIDLKVLDPLSNEYVFAWKEQAKGQEKIPELIDRLSERVRLGLNENARDVKEAKKQVARATTSNMDAYQHYFRGDQYIDDWEFDKAEEELEEAVKLDPQFGLAWARLAYVSSWNASPKAKEQIAKARRFSDGAPEKERLTISALEAEIGNDMKRAIEIRKQILARFPDDKESVYVLGDLAFHTYDYAAARTYLEKVIQIDPRHDRAHYHLVWTDFSTNDFAAGIEHARRFVAQTSSADARCLLVSALFGNEMFAEAIAEARANFASHPDSIPAIFTLAQYLAHTGEYAAAREVASTLRNVPAAQKRASHEVLLAIIAREEGRYREAVKLYDFAKAVASSRGMHARVMEFDALRAHVLAAIGRESETREILRSLTANPADLDVNSRETVILTSIELRDFAAAGQLVPATGEPRIYEALIAIAEARMSGDFTAALEKARTLTRLNAWYGLSWEAHALSALDAGQYDEAASAVKRMYAAMPIVSYNSAYREYLLGRIEEARGNRAAAKSHYQSMLTYWRDADSDIAQLVDAKARLAKL